MKILKIIVGLALLLTTVAKAEIEIIITEGRDDARPVAIIPFKFEATYPLADPNSQPPFDFAKIIADDLRRSGKFKPTEIEVLPATPNALSEVNLEQWKTLGVDGVVYGTVKETSPGRFLVAYDLIDPFNDKAIYESEIEEGSYPIIDQAQHLLLLETKLVSPDNFRWGAHIAADEIYQALTGEKGAFATQIAYVQVNKADSKKYQLYVADSDGFAQKRVFASKMPIMSPVWSPDGKQLAYVSFEHGRSEIIVQTIATAERSILAKYKGFNSAPAWSPDGSKMALVLSKDGNPEIYVMDLATKQLQRLTNHYSIDTEPSWHPDGQSLVFTSDRGGKPQIYRVSLANKQVKRVTFEGKYNAGAEFTPDGDSIVMVHRSNGNYHLASQSLSDGSLNILTNTRLDESLSIAPNGSMIIFSTVAGQRKVLSAVSMDGRFKAQLPANIGEVKAPAWSPFIL